MDKVYDKCCDLDAHKRIIVVCFKIIKQEIWEFGVTTRERLDMVDWLKDSAVKWLS